jgi:hypothetical protein
MVDSRVVPVVDGEAVVGNGQAHCPNKDHLQNKLSELGHGLLLQTSTFLMSAQVNGLPVVGFPVVPVVGSGGGQVHLLNETVQLRPNWSVGHLVNAHLVIATCSQ